jgi:hypothetical protein
MRRRILRVKEDGRRRRSALLAAMASLAVLGAVLISNAGAIQDVGLFELDRNAEDSSAANLPDDWETLHADSTAPFGHSLIFTGILADIETAGDVGDQFAGGGSKDNNNITEWRWKAGEPLDKDDITNAYSAGYTIPVGAPNTGTGADDNREGDFVVYFGLDRFATDGDAQVGFWFTQQSIAKTNVKQNGAFTFSGNHTNGDVLVQSNFTNGGVVDNVSVYKWNSAVSGNLQQIATAGDCLTAGLTDAIACATVNRDSTGSPWSYIGKGTSADGPFPQGAFYEGGINLSRLARTSGSATGCLATFIAETRSSQQFDAVLKDLDLGNFDTCDASVATQSSTNSANLQPGASVSDTAIISGTSLVGGSPPRPTGTVKFFLCQPSAVTSAGCPSGSGTEVTPADTSLADNAATPATNDSIAESNTTTNTTAVGKYCWRAEYTPDTASSAFYSATSHTNATTECFEVAAQPTTTTTRQFVYPQDRAKITAPAATGDLDGDVYFRLFDTETNCDNDDGTASATGLKFASGAIAVDGASGQERKTNQTSYAIDSSKTTTHFWRVLYDADPGSPGSATDRGNAAQLDSKSDCVESTAVTFAGDDGSITVPGN